MAWRSCPVRSGAAIETAFGVSAGVPPDPFFVGLGVLGLLSAAAAMQPLLCVVDDVQWLDQASARALGVAARRLQADAVAVLLAGRELGELAGAAARRLTAAATSAISSATAVSSVSTCGFLHIPASMPRGN